MDFFGAVVEKQETELEQKLRGHLKLGPMASKLLSPVGPRILRLWGCFMAGGHT